MPIKLDLKDRKILYELDRNARQPASQIAKKVGLSPDGVNYRIKRLLKGGAIFKFMTLLDTAKLGLATYKVFYRLQNMTLQKEQEILSTLVQHPHTQLVTSAEGMFDLNVNFLAASVGDLNATLTGLNAAYGAYIAERQVNIMVESHFFLRDYLVGKPSAEMRKPMVFGSKPAPAELDIYHRKILALLAQDARIPAVEIAKRSGLSADAVIQRIRKLEKAGIIQNYVLFPNTEEIGCRWQYLLLRFRDLTPERERHFFQYCRLHQNVWFYSKMIGPWDCVINIEAEHDQQFKELLMEIKKEFSRILKEYTILKITKTHKFNQYPMGES